jgi:hypothetical protein
MKRTWLPGAVVLLLVVAALTAPGITQAGGKTGRAADRERHS